MLGGFRRRAFHKVGGATWEGETQEGASAGENAFSNACVGELGRGSASNVVPASADMQRVGKSWFRVHGLGFRN